MAPTLKHAGRYRDIARLLLAHFRDRGLRVDEQDLDLPPAAEAKAVEDAERLAADLEAMGPTFIKLGQLLSTRSDLLSDPYLEALARLQDDVEPVGFAEIERIVEEEVGARLSNAFQSFDHRPLASASLGQVHQAVLRDGRRVAVKVQRPGVGEQVADDMEVIEELAGFVDSHTAAGDKFGFADMVREFKASITAELDYRQEASHLRLLGEHLADHPALVVPRPVDGYTTSRVLTMDLIDGQSVGSLGPLARTELDGRTLAEALFRAYLQQILEHGFVHADPHPGNVLLTDDGRLALIDLGMVTRLSAPMQDSLIRLLLGVSEGNGDQVADVLVGIGTPGDEFDRDGFRRRIGALVLRHQGTTMGELEAGKVVGELAQVASSAGLRPPPELTMLGKALLNLDEVAARLDPDFDPMATIEDEVGSIMRRKMVRSASPGNLLSAAMDAKEFAERLPGRVNKVMDALAEGQLTLNVKGIDERELIRGIQKVANRVAAGLVIAALIVGAAMIMQIETEAELLGYPALAIVLFIVASIGGIWLVITSLRHDV